MIAERSIIWLFFLLIPTRAVEFAAMHGWPIRPFHIYALLIAAGAVTVARQVRLSDVSLLERGFFAICSILIGWISISPGGRESFEYNLALWPAANLAMGMILFCYARWLGLGSTIISAATGALVSELAGIYADMWFPGLLAEWSARPAGFPQNSNNGALLVTMLLAMLLPVRLRAMPSRPLTCAMIASLPLIFVTLSKSGWIMYAMVAGIYAVTLYFAPARPRPGKRFMAGFAAVFLITALFAPALYEPEAISIWRSRVGVAVPDIRPNFISELPQMLLQGWAPHRDVEVRRDAVAVETEPPERQEPGVGQLRAEKPSREQIDKSIKASAEELLQKQYDESIIASDVTTERRLESAKFFLRAGMEQPLFGHGTGYTYRYKVGPHNQFISLFAEQGWPAALVLYPAALVLLFSMAIGRKAPSLLAIVAIASLNSLVSHTVLIEPLFLVLGGAALGLTGPVGSPRC
jgi:hypothetical protein